ncbi:hypothetical protein QR680_009822 [Steinernema hermaphroditum]|uniref:Trimethylguanosine synthase n=1 Tax=Steinernema hermaphroditum TaxID=289476 RepID=A0AA39IP89_9BILA|nr:hypothetical protein QR680_009822 [Steinernema hermaphroditum]
MSYRFDWEVVAEAEITRSADTRRVILSKAFVNDQDLMRLGDDPSGITGSMEELDVNEEEKLQEEEEEGEDGELDEPTEESSSITVDSNEYELEPSSECTEELPVDFGKRKRHHPRRRRKGGRMEEVNTPESFDCYWARVGEYVVNRSWLNDFGEQMDDEARANFAKKVELQQPSRILNADKDGYSNVFTEAKEDASAYIGWESIFSRFYELVQNLSMRRHQFIITKSSVAGKCKDFFRKISRCGYVPGFRISVSASGEAVVVKDSESSGDADADNGENGPSAKRQATFNPTDIIEKMDFTVYNERPVGHALILATSSSNEAEDEETISTESNSEAPSVDLQKFNFGYDEKNDYKLLACNASQYYHEDKQIMKYWWQRYRLFTRIDDGVLLDREGWFSVTPERVAEHIADRLIQEPGRVILDAFAGVGGNSIQFALKGAHVIAVDLDPVRLKCAKRNAEIYGVADRITFILGDFFHVAKMLLKQKPVDAVFLSPPWGGPSYLKKKEFDITTMVPGGIEIYEAAKALSPNIAYFLPRNTTVKQLLQLADKSGKCEIEHSVLNKKTKAITAYYGDLVASSESSEE